MSFVGFSLTFLEQCETLGNKTSEIITINNKAKQEENNMFRVNVLHNRFMILPQNDVYVRFISESFREKN